MMVKRAFLFLALTVLLFPAALLAQDTTPEAPDTMADAGPDTITIAEPGLMPEGIEWDATGGTFLVGSLSQGTIHRVADDGTLTPLTSSDNLQTSVGLEVDAERNRVLAAASTPERDAAALGAYDLETGEELFYTDLGSLVPDAEGYFANDVAVDADGNAYVTDSAAAVIYQVDVDGNASIFLEDESFVGQFVINGIAFHPDGYLVAVRSPDLIKIPLDDPQSFTVIEVDGEVGNGDGLVVTAPDTLVLVHGDPRQVVRLVSDDDFASATITGQFEPQPLTATTAAVRGDDVYIVYARFSEPDAAEYPIDRVTFSEDEAGE